MSTPIAWRLVIDRKLLDETRQLKRLDDVVVDHIYAKVLSLAESCIGKEVDDLNDAQKSAIAVLSGVKVTMAFDRITGVFSMTPEQKFAITKVDGKFQVGVFL